MIAPHDNTYRDCPGFPGYRIGLDETLWSCLKVGGTKDRGTLTDEWHRVKTHRNSDGYLAAHLRRDNRSWCKKIHQLILEAFVGPCPAGMECLHRDGNPANNELSNLRWGTHVENMADRKMHGREPCMKGEANPNCKLAETDIPIIFDLDASGVGHREIAERYSCTVEMIRYILYGKHWKHLGIQRSEEGKRLQQLNRVSNPPRGSSRGSVKLSEAAIPTIRRYSSEGISLRQIAREFGVAPSTIRQIIVGRTWTHV